MLAAPALAAAVAPHLPGWSALPHDPDVHGAYLVRADGGRVHVTVGGWRMEGRAAFAGCWPRYRDGRPYWHGKRVEITCSARRAPEAVAREIARRLLPAYEVEYAKALAYINARDTNDAEAEAVARRLALAVDGQVERDAFSRRGDGVRVLGGPEAVHRLLVHPAYDGLQPHPCRVSFEVHDLDPETAARALELIGESERARVTTQTRVAEECEEDDLEPLLEASLAMARGARRVANGGGR